MNTVLKSNQYSLFAISFALSTAAPAAAQGHDSINPAGVWDTSTTTATASGGLVLAFTRNEDAIGVATLVVEYNATLAGPWNSASVGASSSGPDANGVTVNTAPNPDAVTVNIPASNALLGKLFGRLKATQS